jgi:DNA helicase TIP49 (TBP-interacting protein)
MGVEITNNHFNIMSDRAYITREGFGYLLNKIKGLTWDIYTGGFKFSESKETAKVILNIEWEYQRNKQSEQKPFFVKAGEHASHDAIIGKAERKARKWLYDYISKRDFSDGDTVTIDADSGDVEDLTDIEKQAEQENKLNNASQRVNFPSNSAQGAQKKQNIPCDNKDEPGF